MEESFTYKYHKDVLKHKKALKNPDGSVTTVRVIGVPYKGKIYNIPSYNYKTGKIMSESEAFKKFKKNIDAGEVEGYLEEWGGDIKEHPANIAARLEHFSVDADLEKSFKAIGYGK